LGKYRDSLSIIGDILRIADSGANKTKIMFSANLSFKLLEKYLAIVINSGLIEIRDKSYELTPLGREFVKDYDAFKERYSITQQMLESVTGERRKLLATYTGNFRQT
jgi:predicted transcriptional regulator